MKKSFFLFIIAGLIAFAYYAALSSLFKAPAFLLSFANQTQVKITNFTQSQFINELAEHYGFIAKLQNLNGESIFLGIVTFIAFWVVITVIANFFGFWRDLFAFFPLKK